MWKNFNVEGYTFSLDKKMLELIEHGVVYVKTYAFFDGDKKPWVEIQTDLDITKTDYCEWVDEFDTIDEAIKCGEIVAIHLGVPFKKV